MLTKTQTAHKAFIGLAQRAEKVSNDILGTTFVDTEPLSSILMTPNNQILYGRRGTGKTHALQYLAESISSDKDRTIYMDLRSIGSDGSVYSDSQLPIPARAVKLIQDVLKCINLEFYEIACEAIENCPHPKEITDRLNDFENAISHVRVEGNVSISEMDSLSEARQTGMSSQLSLTPNGLGGTLGAERTESSGQQSERHTIREGIPTASISFGAIQTCVRSLLEILGNPTLWILLDEWSEVPTELQAYLADLIRKTLLPINGIVVKIAAIEHRSQFYLPLENNRYIGLELGADISADLVLDDFLVFDNDEAKSVNFFKRLLFQHVKATDIGDAFTNENDLIQSAFSQNNSFAELVRAAEGVPRDAINLVSKAAAKSYGTSISIPVIKQAANDWYNQDKAMSVQTSPELQLALEFIISDVIGARKARAFMLKAKTKNEIIDRLFDYRVIHLLKKNISAHDQPGERYNAFKIDYGSYVQLMNTAHAVTSLFHHDDDREVPPDDYRSIRRAILDIDAMMAHIQSAG